MKNYNQNKFLRIFDSDSNISLKSSNNIKLSNISNKEITLDKKNKSENLTNKIPKYIPSTNKNLSSYKNANNHNLIKDINSENKMNLSLENSNTKLSLQNINIDPESLTFANKSYMNNTDEYEELSELNDIDSNIDYEEFNNKILLTQILDDEKHKKMFNKNNNLKKVFEGSILITKKNNNDINHKREEIYLGQMKANLSYKWE